MSYLRKLVSLIIVALLLQLFSPALTIKNTVVQAAANGPVIVSRQPAENTTNVGVKPSIEIVFDEAIAISDGNKKIRIITESTNKDLYSYPVNSRDVSISNRTLRVTLRDNEELLENTNYYILLENDAVKNVSNNAALATDQIWRFKTVEKVDTTPPLVTDVSYSACTIEASSGNSTSTCSELTDTSVNSFGSIIKLTFSEPVYTHAGTLTLSAQGGGDTRQINIYSPEVSGAGSTTISIKPSQPLKANTRYTLTVEGGNQANFKDEAGNRLQNSFSRSFTTAQDKVPLQSVVPSGSETVNLTNNVTSLVLHFNTSEISRVVPVKDKNITVKRVRDNTIVGSPIAVRNATTQAGGTSFTYQTPTLQPNTEYYVIIDGGSFVSSDGKEQYRGINNSTEWKFKTTPVADTQAPSITTYSPANNASKISRNQKIVLTFNENVYANSGTIVIKDYSSNIVYRSIDVTSSRVTGAGTSTITIDPHRSITNEVSKTFASNQRYYVEISAGAFKDSSNNVSRAITGKSQFNFSTGEVTNAKPLLTAIKPVNGTESVAAGTPTFTMTFDKAVGYAVSTGASIYPSTSSSGNNAIALDITGLSSNKRTVSFTPRTALVANSSYYINIPNNLIYDEETANDIEPIYYDGILNTYQWTFRTLGGDRTAPKMLRAEANGNKIRVVYDELLDEATIPLNGNYYITVDGASKNISSLEVVKNAVIFTMYESINSNNRIFVSYSKPNTNAIRDISGNVAEGFSGLSVVYGQISSTPTILKSSSSGRTITLEFNEPLQHVNSLAYLQFAVQVNNENNPVTSIKQSGTTITLGVQNTILASRTTSVKYAKGVYPLEGFTNEVGNFSLTVGQSGSIQTPSTTSSPAISNVVANGNQITINFNMSIANQPTTNQFVVTQNFVSRTVTNVKLESQAIVLTLDSSLDSNDTVRLTYLGSVGTATNALSPSYYTPTTENIVATFGAATVEGKPTLQSVIAKGNLLTLNFNKQLDSSYLPSSSQFYIMVNRSSYTARSLKIEGMKLIITLSSAITIGSEGTVTYYTTQDTLRATDGERVATFNNVKITNQTSIIDVLSDDYAELDRGVRLKEATATQTDVLLPSGRSTTKYTIENVKISTVVDAFQSAGVTEAVLEFEVSSSKSGAVVAIPMASIQNAARKGNYTFAVKYGDIYMEIPTSAIDISKALTLNTGNSYTNYLTFTVEAGSSSETTGLESVLRSNNVAIVGGPYLFNLEVVGPSGQKQDVPLSGNIVRRVVLPQSLSEANTAAVFYDEVAGHMSGMPTIVNSLSGRTEVTFMRPGSSAYAIVTSNQTYSDLNNHWATNTITRLSRKFIIEGHSATSFSPQKNITRGEFATYLAKGLGLSVDNEAAKVFKDVDYLSNLGGYIGAAVKAGIVNGVSATQFKPNDNITRQDMAIMMMRMVAFTKQSFELTTSADAYLASYKDAGQVSSYAKLQVAQAIQIGIMNGKTTTTLSPLSNATRAEGVTMIERVLEKVNYLQ